MQCVMNENDETFTTLSRNTNNLLGLGLGLGLGPRSKYTHTINITENRQPCSTFSTLLCSNNKSNNKLNKESGTIVSGSRTLSKNNYNYSNMTCVHMHNFSFTLWTCGVILCIDKDTEDVGFFLMVMSIVL